MTMFVKIFETKTPVNMLVKIPKHKISAKPLTGPFPIVNKIIPVIIVVIFASRMVEKALL